MHACKNQDINHVKCMSYAGYWDVFHAYNMCMLCKCLYMRITEALKCDFLPVLQQTEV